MVQNTVQSSYGTRPPVAFAGMPADMHGWDADTGIAEGNIGFGLAASRGSADNGLLVGGATFKGITYRDITLVHTTADRYETGDNVGLMNRGDIWVAVATDVVNDKQVFYNSSTGALGASTISNAVAIAGAIFLDTVASGGFSRVRLSNGIGDTTT